jgi:hypothetical protein
MRKNSRDGSIAARTALSHVNLRNRSPTLPAYARNSPRHDHQMTLALLWEEYKAEHPQGYQYSRFCELYRRFEKRLSVVLRQVDFMTCEFTICAEPWDPGWCVMEPHCIWSAPY